MPVYIPQDIRSGVIRHWLMGNSRDEIASKFLVSTGAVTNIVNEWRSNVGSLVAEDLRELSLSLKKVQMSPIECSTGLRIEKMMQRFGINEDQYENFMTEIYNKCQILEIAPEQIGKYLAETISLSEIVFPSEIPSYINTKKTEIEELEKQIENRNEIISKLDNEILNLEEKQESLIKNNDISIDAINWYKDIKEELTNMGIPFDDIYAFIECLRQIRNEGYNVNKIVTKFSELDYFDKLIDEQKEIIHKNINEIEQLKNIKNELEKQIDFIQLKLAKNQELENIGMGYKELKTIYNTIIEISKINNINPKEAIEMFFNDLNEYDDIVGFKKKVEDLKKEAHTLNLQITNNRIIQMSQQHIGDILQNLLKKGISEKDIEDIDSILSFGEFDEYDDKKNNNIIINKQSLMSELDKYRTIKLVVELLKQKQIQLINNIKELDNQKMILEKYVNHIFMLFSNLKELQILLKKIDIALEFPKILLIYLSSDNFKDENKTDQDL